MASSNSFVLDRLNKIEILLKVALNTTKPNHNQFLHISIIVGEKKILSNIPNVLIALVFADKRFVESVEYKGI
jgi:hypothetical protein